MKPSFFCLPAALFFLVSCAAQSRQHLPDLAAAGDREENPACAEFFPSGKWQFVHSIIFSMENGAGSTVIGVTSLTGTTIETALVTVEGLTLFEAVYRGDNSFEIQRAVPPFDRPGFAMGLIQDVRAVFRPPAGSDMRAGKLADRTPACRYTAADGSITDIVTGAEDCLQVKSYGSDLVLERSIIGKSCRKTGSDLIPEYIELKTFGPSGYILKMTLIRADQIK
jgi:hypothetical protein